jgi:hypothetical protein
MRIFLFRPHPWQIRVLCKVPRPPFFSAGLISIYHHIAGVEQRRRLDVHLPYGCGNQGKDDPPVVTILTFDIDDIPQKTFYRVFVRLLVLSKRVMQELGVLAAAGSRPFWLWECQCCVSLCEILETSTIFIILHFGPIQQRVLNLNSGFP